MMQLLPHHLSISVDLLSSSFVLVIFSKIPNGIFSVFLIFFSLEGDEVEEGEDDPPPKRRKFEILKENELPSKMRTKIKETSRSNNIENPIIVRDIGESLNTR